MTTKHLETERLMLRPIVPGDADDLFEGIADWDVISMLAVPPCRRGPIPAKTPSATHEAAMLWLFNSMEP